MGLKIKTIDTGGAIYKCNTNNAAPCIYDSRFDSDLAGGTVKGRVVRNNIHVKQGKNLTWVDPCSRKHFTSVNRESHIQDKKDSKFLIDKLSKLGIDDIPDDAKLWELGETYNLADKRLNLSPKKLSENRNRTFGAKKVTQTPVPPEFTKKELRKKVKSLGGTFKENDNKDALEKTIADLEQGED